MAELTLFESQLSPKGATYTACANSRSAVDDPTDRAYSRADNTTDVDQDEYASGRAQRAGDRCEPVPRQTLNGPASCSPNRPHAGGSRLGRNEPR